MKKYVKTEKKSRIINTLRLLANATPEQRRLIISIAPKSIIRLITETALNLYKRNIKITPKRVRSLVKYKRLIRKLATAKTLDTNRAYLKKQSGSGMWLPLILGTVLPNIISGLAAINKP